LISDANGEQTKSFIVNSIANEEHATIIVHGDKRHSYEEGDYVRFVEVEGMPEINNREPIEIIKVKGPFVF
jgi:ubiquitin-activating enzyme E1